jgi:hypothetical protein
LLVVCTSVCCLFIHLLRPFDLSSPSVWLLYALPWMPLTFQCRMLLRFLFLRLTSTGYQTALQKAPPSPRTEYENCDNGIFGTAITFILGSLFDLKFIHFHFLVYRIDFGGQFGAMFNETFKQRSGQYWWKCTDIRHSKYSKNTLSHYYFVQHKFHTEWPGFEHGPVCREVRNEQRDTWHFQTACLVVGVPRWRSFIDLWNLGKRG